ncbi:hypothetical protein ElyMa_004301200, partial [Elysia marginata]
MPRGIASNGEVSYSVTNLDSALTMLIAMYVYGEEAVKDTKQIALENTIREAELLSMGRRCAAVLNNLISMYPNKWERRPRSQVVEEKVQLTQLSTTLTTPRLTSPRELQFSLRPAVRPRLPSPISVTARSTGSK